MVINKDTKGRKENWWTGIKQQEVKENFHIKELKNHVTYKPSKHMVD